MDDGFDVEGLREEVGECDGTKRVTGRQQRTQVAAECGRITRDVDKGGRGALGEKGGDVRAQAAAWRVDNDQVGAIVFRGLTKEVESGAAGGIGGSAL